MANPEADLLQGTLDLLALKALQHEPRHGFGVLLRIQQMSQDMLTVEQGSLYPALYRLEERGWIKSEWGVSENNRRAKFYSLTPKGRRQLSAQTADWKRFAGVMAVALNTRVVEG